MTSRDKLLDSNTPDNDPFTSATQQIAPQTDHVTRRGALKSMTRTVAAGTAAIATIGHAATSSSQQPLPQPMSPLNKSQWVSGHDGILVFVDDWDGVSNRDMRAVSFLNTSEQPVTLDQINPGLLSADDQVFNLNHILGNGSITLMPQETISFGLYPIDAANAEMLSIGQHNSVSTLVRCAPHTMVVDGTRNLTQYAVIV